MRFFTLIAHVTKWNSLLKVIRVCVWGGGGGVVKCKEKIVSNNFLINATKLYIIILQSVEDDFYIINYEHFEKLYMTNISSNITILHSYTIDDI